MKADCHTHSIFSSDGKLSIEEMLNIALERGLSYLAVTDHIDFDALLPKNRAPSYWKQPDVDLYCAEVERLKPVAEKTEFSLLSARKWASTPTRRRRRPRAS